METAVVRLDCIAQLLVQTLLRQIRKWKSEFEVANHANEERRKLPE